MASNKNRRRARKVAEQAVKKSPTWIIVTAIILVIVVVAGYFIYTKFFKKGEQNPGGNTAEISGELSFHFMMLGNKSSGDSIYVKAGDKDILIDAGSTTGSVSTIKNYLDNYVTDGVLEYVIVTHADTDHIAGFSATNGIFSLYECETIIDFPRTDKTTDMYYNYVANRDAEVQAGAKHFNALQCYNNEGNGAQRVYNLTDSVSMEILYNYYYEYSSGDENNYSVCVMFNHGERQFLLTGDLEEDGEKRLAQKYAFNQVELYKAGHHGSATSSTTELLSEIKPKLCVVSCVAGDKYNFPTQAFIDRIAPYTSKVFVTTMKTASDGFEAMNGNVVVSSSAEKAEVEVTCSNNNTVLKDTAWFSANRTPPPAWEN